MGNSLTECYAGFYLKGVAEVYGNRTHLGQPSLPHTGFEVRQIVSANSRAFLLLSVIKKSCLFRDVPQDTLQ